MRDDDRGNLVSVDLNEGLADTLVHRHQADGLARRALGRHVNVVQPFDGGGHADVQLDDDLVGLLRERRRIAHGHRGHNRAGFRDGGGFDDCHVDRSDVAGPQLLHRFRQVLINESDLALVDLAPQRGVDLERHAARQGIRLGQHLVRIVTQRRAGDQRDRQRLAFRAAGQRRRHGLTVARTGEPAHANGHAVLNQQCRLVGGRDLGEQARMANTVEMHGVSRFKGQRLAAGRGDTAQAPGHRLTRRFPISRRRRITPAPEEFSAV
ncbi:hypothetical protein D3C87_1307050 [compost metagenome]